MKFDKNTEWEHCDECNRNFPTNECFMNHEEEIENKKGDLVSMCATNHKCETCKIKFDPTKKEHKCGHRVCRNCKQLQPFDHKCFIEAVELKEPNEK